MASRIFQEQLSFGQAWEITAQELIKQLKDVEVIEVQTSDNYSTMHYDFRTSDDMTYEVKADRVCATTGNFFIEYESFGKPSGISITKAKKHILTDETTYFVIRTKKLKELIMNNNYRMSIVKYSNNKGTLVPRTDILEHALTYACV